jgi:hypothetical protein
MESKSLGCFVAANGQTEASRLLGVSAPAISKALSAKRHITVSTNVDGSFTACETRPFPSKAAGRSDNPEAPPTLYTNVRTISSAGQSADDAGVLYSTQQAIA